MRRRYKKNGEGTTLTAEERLNLPVSYHAFTDTMKVDLIRTLAQNRHFSLRMAAHLVPERTFDNLTFQWVSGTVLEYWKKYATPPGHSELQSILRSETERGYMDSQSAQAIDRFIHKELFKPVYNEPFIMDKATGWITDIERAHLLEEIKVSIQTGDRARATELFTKGAHTNADSSVATESFVKDVKSAVDRRRNLQGSGIPSGLPIDSAMADGGPRRGSLNAIIGPTNTGKTAVASYMGTSMVRSGYKVLHVSLETEKEEVRNLYDASWMNASRRHLGAMEDQVLKATQEMYENHGDALRFVRYLPEELTGPKLRSLLYAERANGFIPDAVIIDSPDDMLPYEGWKGDQYQLGNDVYIRLLAIAVEFNCVIWVTTQGNRSSFGKAIVDLSNVGDSVRKVQRPHSVTCLSQSPIMSSFEPFPILGLFLAKQRWGRKNLMYYLSADYDRVQFQNIPPSDPMFHAISDAIQRENEQMRQRY